MDMNVHSVTNQRVALNVMVVDLNSGKKQLVVLSLTGTSQSFSIDWSLKPEEKRRY